VVGAARWRGRGTWPARWCPAWITTRACAGRGCRPRLSRTSVRWRRVCPSGSACARWNSGRGTCRAPSSRKIKRRDVGRRTDPSSPEEQGRKPADHGGTGLRGRRGLVLGDRGQRLRQGALRDPQCTAASTNWARQPDLHRVLPPRWKPRACTCPRESCSWVRSMWPALYDLARASRHNRPWRNAKPRRRDAFQHHQEGDIRLRLPCSVWASAAGGRAETFLHAGAGRPRCAGRAMSPAHAPSSWQPTNSSHLRYGCAVKVALGEAGRDLASLAAADYFFSNRWRRAYFANLTIWFP